MAIKNKEEYLKKVEEIKKIRHENRNIKILIGYGTCGLAAGAKSIEESLKKSIAERSIKNVEFVKVGCIGFCHAEPTIEVVHPDGESVLLGNLTVDNAHNIIDIHILNKSHDRQYVIHRNFDESYYGDKKW